MAKIMWFAFGKKKLENNFPNWRLNFLKRSP